MYSATRWFLTVVQFPADGSVYPESPKNLQLALNFLDHRNTFCAAVTQNEIVCIHRSPTASYWDRSG